MLASNTATTNLQLVINTVSIVVRIAVDILLNSRHAIHISRDTHTDMTKRVIGPKLHDKEITRLRY
ncbi:Uncharacterised protein [Escherichia coli]|nr:Uncharacterised protein [Escherichia coli]